MSEIAVVKVGGSLYDLPDLSWRLQRWLDTDARVQPPTRIILVPGGGPTTDAVRVLDRTHDLGDEQAHWLALRALSLNAHFLANLLPGARVSTVVQQVETRWNVLDALAFFRTDEELHNRPTIPHVWAASSDTVAARVAVAAQARRLILLKSVTMPSDVSDWEEAGRRHIVDSLFAPMLRQSPPELEVSTVNLREWQG